jgi:hypothetical protein
MSPTYCKHSQHDESYVNATQPTNNKSLSSCYYPIFLENKIKNNQEEILELSRLSSNRGSTCFDKGKHLIFGFELYR